MTNETITNILERRSVRKFLPGQVEDEKMQAILECGLWAPSASNSQDWHVTVIRSKQAIDNINQKLKEFMLAGPKDVRHYNTLISPDYHVFFHAPLIMLLSYDSASMRWGTTNLAMMAENMCIAAQSSGMASLHVGLVTPMLQSDFGRNVCDGLGVPVDYVPHMFVAFGYQDTTVRTTKKPRRDGTVNYID